MYKIYFATIYVQVGEVFFQKEQKFTAAWLVAQNYNICILLCLNEIVRICDTIIEL